jgi:hypothetical protein
VGMWSDGGRDRGEKQVESGVDDSAEMRVG